ncbi:MAG: pilin [Candidatus Paceibacterota bacterium]|jgi:type IV secretory pathway VirB2 component (pilin)
MKHVKYILILIILVGIFGTITQVSAQGYRIGDTSTQSGTTAADAINVQNARQILNNPNSTPAQRATATAQINAINAQAAAANPPPTQTPSTPANTKYQLLAPLPDPYNNNQLKKEINTTSGFGAYLNLMIKIFIGLAAVLSVVMIVVGGLEVMTSELSHTKTAGKEKIAHAILGLVIALGAYALLYTINPDLLKSDLCIHPQVFQNGKCVNP